MCTSKTTFVCLLLLMICQLVCRVRAVPCPAVSVQNAHVSYTDDIMEDGGSYTVFCELGYVIRVGQNSLTSTCLNGTWATAPPARCDAINCGQLTAAATQMTLRYENSSLGDYDYGQEITGICPSGMYAVSRLDSSDVVKLRCNATGQWEVVQGFTNRTARMFDCAASGNHHGCYVINDTLPEINVTENSGTISANRAQCLNYCKQNGMVFAARQGEMCHCLVHLPTYKLTSSAGCNVYCQDQLSICGGNGDIFSVWNTIYSCAKIDSSHTWQTQRKMYTADTCQQYCRGADQILAFWRKDVRTCNCFNTIPPYTGSNYCYYPVEIIDVDIGELYITDLYSNTKYNNCKDFFEDGIFHSGQYYLMNGQKITCYFLDNSTTECKENWIAYKENCYLFLDERGDAEYHHYNSCIAQNSHLVSVGDSSEGNFLTYTLKQLKHLKFLPVYIGMYDIQNTFSYMWADETAVSYRDFATDYPQIISNRCVVYEAGTMKNVPCTDQIGAICESSKASIGCASANSSDLQIKSMSLKMSTPFCFESCRASDFSYSATRNTTCFCTHDISQFQLLQWQECNTPCPRNKYQICGGNDNDTVFITADVGQPYRESCLTMILGSLLTNVTVKTSNGTLQNVDCLEYAGVVCPESWVEINGHCYRFFIESIESPALMCSAIGGYLVVYETEEEGRNVIDTIQMTPMLYKESLWIFGLFHYRLQKSHLRNANGAYVNVTLRQRLDDDGSICYAHDSFNANKLVGVLCNKFAYICERGPARCITQPNGPKCQILLYWWPEFPPCEDYWFLKYTYKLLIYRKKQETKSLDYITNINKYRGCFFTLPSQYQSLTGYRDITVTQCLETCKSSHKKLAGVRFQTACYCIGSENITRTSSDVICEKNCGQQNCGSTLNEAMTVYTIDYSKNASTCEELFDQGVLQSGLYSLSNGVATWCGMKNSRYLAQQVELWTTKGAGEVNFTDFSWHRVGTDNITLAIDVVNGSKSSLLYQRCAGAFQQSSIMATVKTRDAQQLIIEILKWSLDVISIPAYVGLVDQFYLGMYTWSDGSLFRLSQVNWTEVSEDIFVNASRSIFMSLSVDGQFQGQNRTDSLHAVCQRDFTYQGCLFMASQLPSSLYAAKNYNSMSLTLCRQLCQINATNQVLISTRDCICYDPIENNFNLMTYFNSSNDSRCDVPCPGNELQKCGATSYFRSYTIEQDMAQSCEELYNNFVLLPGNYLINGSITFCGVDDLSVSCPPGFVAMENKCYRFYRQQSKNLQTAAAACLSEGSYLAAPLNMTTLNKLASLIRSISSFQKVELWLVGIYSPFINGYYVTSQGHMIPLDDPVMAHIKTDRTTTKYAVALNVTSGQLVTVSKGVLYPFICQTQEEVSGCAKVNQSSLLWPFPLFYAMSIQQCLAFCKGSFGTVQVYAALQEYKCGCVMANTQLNLTQRTCKSACKGNSMQQCGSVSDGVYSVYKLTNYNSKYLNYDCDSLLAYGVIQPATYVVDTSEYRTCFKYSSKSRLLLGSASNLNVTSSLSSSNPQQAVIKLPSLTFQGWKGDNQSDVFFQFDLNQFYLFEGFVLYGNMESISLLTSLDGVYFEPHPDNVIVTEMTYLRPTWITLSQPVTGRWVKIKFESWAVYPPIGSAELIGYPYSEHNVTNNYRGCHSNLTWDTLYVPVNTSYEDCRTQCKDSGFPYLILKSPDDCMCASGQATRDFYADDTTSCSELCFGGGYPCSVYDKFQALYLTTDVGCTMQNMSNSNMSVRMTFNDTGSEMLPLLTQLTYNCLLGHEINASLSAITSTCFNFGKWIPSLTNISCERKNCGGVPNVSDAQVETENVTTLYGDTIQYICDQEGFRFNGTIEFWNMSCNEFKLWTPPALPCQAVTCLDKPVVENAFPNNTATVSMYNSAISYTCDDGCYFPSDNQTERVIQCLITGLWSDIEPACQRLYCSKLPPLRPSTSIVLTNQSDLAYYQCENGTHFTDGLQLKETWCSNETLLWSDIGDSCQSREYEEGYIWRAHVNTYLDEAPTKETNSRSLVDCAIRCLDIAGCSMFNFKKNNGSNLCRLYARSRLNFTSAAIDKWDIYFVNRS